MAWENLLPQAGQVKMNSLSDYSWPMPAQNEMALLGAADMLDQRQARQIQNRIAKLQYETSEAHVQGQKELSQYASAERTGQNDVFTSQGYVPADRYMTWATRYPQEAASERQQQTDNALAIATERRKAAETLMNSFVKAGYNPTEINGQVAALYPDVAASLTMPNRQADTQPTNALATPVARPGMFVDPGQIGKTANAFLQGGNALTPNAPPGVPPTQPPSASISPGMTPGQGGQPNAPVQAPQPAVAAPTPQPAPQPAQSVPANSRQAFLDKVNEAQTNPDTQKGLEMLGAIRPSNNWEMNELKAARMFLATKASTSKEPNATEANYRLGLEDQLKQQHPDWSPKKIQFEAAKQIRKENADAAKQRIQFGVTLKADQASKDIDIKSIAQSVYDGNDARMAIKGSMGNPVATKVESEILKEHPKFNFMMSDANYKWKQSATNQRTINFAGGALPRLTMLDSQLNALPNVDLNTINRIMKSVSVETGHPEYTNYESNRNSIAQEINTALSGSSASSDVRVMIELENLKSARSPAQIRGAISNLREALIARLDTDLSPIYPLEVVRGEKTLQQYKDEMFKKYRGNYKAQTTDAAAQRKAAPEPAAQNYPRARNSAGDEMIFKDGKWQTP